ncbi:MAG: ATP-dependent RNA helicase [Alectoria sarmentosa]|nr:MAG: ATP-dependent RNA helicase [Alectoria sarmentosa]
MAPIEKKRHRDLAAFKAKKRQRADHESNNSREGHKAGAVGLDKLPWNEVAVDRLDDAEGFFGLEELSDVDVVRDSMLGKVEYKLLSSKSATLANQYSRVICGTEGTDEQEWEGFDEEESEKHVEARRSDGTDLVGKDNRKSKKKRRKQEEKQKKRAASQPNVSKNAFEALGTANEGEDIADDEGDVSAWHPLNLSSRTLSSLARMKFSQPTAIQQSAIPEILGGHDVIGKAPTGSGKTLAFGIPIYEHYLKTIRGQVPSAEADGKERQQPPMALVLSPTRELAHQLSAHLTDLCSNPSSAHLSIATLTGGLSVHKQQRQLAHADIIVGTPGRLWEVFSGSQDLLDSLRRIKFLVVDEADRLLSEGHFKEVEEIFNVLDRTNEATNDEAEGESETFDWKQQRQTLVFSATFQKDLQQKLAGKGKSIGGDLMGKRESLEYLLKKLNFRDSKPKFIDVNPVSQMATGLKEGIVECGGTEKDLYLYATLLLHPHTRTLIFTNSITSVRRLTPFLQNLTLPAYPLHSQMPQKARLRSVERFSSASSPSSILIATDVAARGLDIPSVQLVLHYHLPRAADMYVHRSGRTARAEKSGSSILLCSPEEVQGMRRLIAKVHARNASKNDSHGKKFFMQTLDLNTRVVSRLKSRVVLSKRISDAALAKEKKGHEDNWLKTAAEDLGVDYDSEEFAAGEASKKGRGQGRKEKEKEARGLTKGELGALRGELKGLLGQRVNVGVSEKYLTAGGIDVDELLSGERGEFLGRVESGLDDI